jgi:CelD/BcsL family acetyltransferase involved in cellulose biosynthesis
LSLLPAGRIAEAASVWQRLEQRLGDPPLACSWAWTETWLDEFGPVVPHRFAVARRGSVACGVALVTYDRERHGGMWLRTVHLGTVGEPPGESIYVQRNGLLCDPADRAAVAGALVEELRRSDGFDELRLDGFIPEHAAVIGAGDPSARTMSLPCPTVDLRAADLRGGNVLELLSANTRYQVRRSMRGYGALRAEYAESVDDALEILDELVVLHQRRWTAAGEPGAFGSRRQLAFHRRLISRLLPAGRVVVFRVRNSQGTIGCLYSHVDEGAVVSYQIGLAPSTDNKLKPGFVTHTLCMQACFDRGYDLYDFLSGGGAYKSELSTGVRDLVWARGLRHGRAVGVADALHRARRRARAVGGRSPA